MSCSTRSPSSTTPARRPGWRRSTTLGQTLLADAPAGSTLTFTCQTDPASGNAAGAYNVGDKVIAHVTYVHSFVTPLIGDLFGGSIEPLVQRDDDARRPADQLLLMGAHANTGSVLVIVVLSLTVLLGIAALAIDAGGFRAHRRQLQSAADAGALAGAQKLINHASTRRARRRTTTSARTTTAPTAQHDRRREPRHELLRDPDLARLLAAVRGARATRRVGRARSSSARSLGFLDTDISARARARIVYLTKSKGLLPFGVEDLRPNVGEARDRPHRPADPARPVRVLRADRRGLPVLVLGGLRQQPAGGRIDGLGAGRGHDAASHDHLEQHRLCRQRPVDRGRRLHRDARCASRT